jgi:hypothetical protein
MSTVIFRDVRLNGYRPSGDAIDVNFDTPLQFLIDQTVVRGKANGGNLLVQIMCHGLPGFLQCCRGANAHPTAGNGITSADLPTFKSLKGHVARIELHACLVARMGPCFESTSLGHTVGYDGNALCFKLAQTTGAQVKASIHIQWYNDGTYQGGASNGKGTSFGHWNGRVFTWDKTGTIVDTNDYPYHELPGGTY